MEQTRGEEIGTKNLNATPLNEELPTAAAAADALRNPAPLRRTVSTFQKTLSKTSLLVNFLPTGTLLTFETLLPTFYRGYGGGSGACNRVTAVMLTALLTLCALSCFFFHFTDSFSAGGRVYYGFVTPRGLAAFNPGVEEPNDKRYRLRFPDVVHAVMSAMVFLAIAFSDHRVTGCLFPGYGKEIDEVMDQGFPLIVGIVCSALFLVYPKDRHGIGFMEAAA